MERIRQVVVGVVVVGVGLLATPSDAQQKKGRDFSGTWVLDLSRSGSIEQNNDLPKATLVITAPQDELLQIVSMRGAIHELVQFRFGPANALRARAPGSREHVGVILTWEGDELFTATPTNINDTAVTVVEQRRLNHEGTEMTVETRVDVEHGYTGTTQNSSPRVKDVYVKKAP